MRGTVPGDCASATGAAARSRTSAMLVSQMIDGLRAALTLGYERITERRREPFEWSSPLHVSAGVPNENSTPAYAGLDNTVMPAAPCRLSRPLYDRDGSLVRIPSVFCGGCATRSRREGFMVLP